MNKDTSAAFFEFLLATRFNGALGRIQPRFNDALNRLALNDTLDAQTVLTWPTPTRFALRELLVCWFLTSDLVQDKHYTKPSIDMSDEAYRKATLPAPIVAEILQRSSELRSLYQRSRQSSYKPRA
jgi:hypothetical protein